MKFIVSFRHCYDISDIYDRQKPGAGENRLILSTDSNRSFRCTQPWTVLHTTTHLINQLGTLFLLRNHIDSISTVQITFIFIGQTHLVFGKRVCTCVTKHSNAFRNFLNWLKNSKRVWHEPKLHILRLPLFANFDL